MSRYEFEETEDDNVLRVGQGFETLFQNDQLKYYQRRTVEYWRKAFSALASTMKDEEIEELALESMKRAEYWKGRTEREIWNYMIPIGYFGFYFDIDPQYEHMRIASGWNDLEEPFEGRINGFLDQIDIYYPIYWDDWGPADEKFAIIVKFYRSWNEKDVLSLEQQKVRLASLAQELYPRKWESLSEQARSETLESNLKRATNLDLSTKNAIVYGLAAIYFGMAFERSPVFPWARILMDKKLAEEKRIKQFIKAAETYFNQLTTALKQ